MPQASKRLRMTYRASRSGLVSSASHQAGRWGAVSAAGADGTALSTSCGARELEPDHQPRAAHVAHARAGVGGREVMKSRQQLPRRKRGREGWCAADRLGLGWLTEAVALELPSAPS